MVIKEYPPRSTNTNRLRNLLKELESKTKFIPDIIYVDYLGIMIANQNNKHNNTNTEMKIISEELRGLAVEQGIPIVSSVQTNRCLSIYTIVEVFRKRKKQKIFLKDIKTTDLIKSFDGFKKIIEKYDIKTQQCYEITLKSGKKIICSDKHLFPTEYGFKNIKHGLKIGDCLHSKQTE